MNIVFYTLLFKIELLVCDFIHHSIPEHRPIKDLNMYITTSTVKSAFVVIIIILSGMLLTVNAEINKTKPPFSLTLAQVKNWSPTSSSAEPTNVSTITLQARFIAHLDEKKLQLDERVKLLLAPDGMNNLANYIEPQDKFNLYNFTHWSYVDVLNWFTGEATVNVPAKPWIDTAHKNGVKVIGTVFFRPAQYGGNADTVAMMLEVDEYGNFPYANKLVEIALYYGFDGWLMNQETDLTVVKNANNEIVSGQFDYIKAAELAKKMQRFMAYLTKMAPEGMEIHWYDSMLLDGSVRWQNQLNELSSPFLQDDKITSDKVTDEVSGRVSDSIFLNYWWNADMVKESVEQAKNLERSAYDIYFGADLWPDRNAQRLFKRRAWLDALFTDNGNKGQSSIALFANNASFIFSGSDSLAAYSNFQYDANDYLSFYQSEVRLFSGDDLNVFLDDKPQNWPGLGRYIPAKSTLSQLPFSTSFNTGHGKFTANKGKIQQGAWHDVGQQDILPTWQFAVEGNKSLSVFFDFEQAYSGGNSLALRAKSIIKWSLIPLYKTAFVLDENSLLSVIFKHNSPTTSVWIWLETVDKVKIKYPLMSDTNQWSTVTVDLKHYQGKVIDKIGFMVLGQNYNLLSTNIGAVRIQ